MAVVHVVGARNATETR